MKFLTILVSLLIISFLNAQKFYVDPVYGHIEGDGSQNNPWQTIQEVIESGKIESMQPAEYPYDGTGELKFKNQGAPVSAGDTLILRSGYHGEIYLLRYFNSSPITIMAEDGQTPTLSRLKLTGAKYWEFKGLTVSPSFADTFVTGNLFRLESHNWSEPVTDIVIENCTGYSVEDASGWTVDDWNNYSCNGISCSASNVELLNNKLTNVNFGITASGNNIVVRNNSVINFSGDGLRGLGDDLLFEYNLVKNCYDVNGNHDDGFQSWAIDGDPPERVTLRGNIIINYEDPEQPHLGTLQGIGLFDGPYVDWVIENNLIMVDHWHGISMYKGINCRIVNNTVVDLNDTSPGPPWIRMTDHKDGSHSENSFVRNNLATSFAIGEGVTADHNIKITDYNDYFVDYTNGDLHLLPNSEAVDSGYSVFAPLYDIEGTARPQGIAVDIGAYEFSDPANLRQNGFIPDEFELFQNYPNPFNPETTIEFNIPGSKEFYSPLVKTSLSVYNLLGQKVAVLLDDYLGQGKYSIKFNASGLPSGVYLYRLSVGSYNKSLKMIYLK